MLTKRIINGKSVDSPPSWMGQIFHNQVMKCGCTLTSSNWILTAAHCVYKHVEPKHYRIRFGGGGSKYKISSIFIHPQFEDTKYSHDIAMLRLSKSVDIVPVQLYQNDTILPILVSIMGWGYIDTKHDVPKKLQMATNLEVLPFIICENLYGLQRSGSDLQLCINQTTSGSYKGDSGGPLLTIMGGGGDTQIGIVSFDARDDVTMPGVYTKVSVYQDWMRQVLMVPPPPSSIDNTVLITAIVLAAVILVSLLFIVVYIVKKLQRQQNSK